MAKKIEMKKKKEIVIPKTYTFDEIFLPLTLTWGKTFANDHMAFDFPSSWLNGGEAVITSFKDQEIIVAQLNGEKVEKPLKYENLTHADSYIYIDGKEFISIRGWGHLCGYLKLSEKDAAIIQDAFADYIIKTLS